MVLFCGNCKKEKYLKNMKIGFIVFFFDFCNDVCWIIIEVVWEYYVIVFGLECDWEFIMMYLL